MGQYNIEYLMILHEDIMQKDIRPKSRKYEDLTVLRQKLRAEMDEESLYVRWRHIHKHTSRTAVVYSRMDKETVQAADSMLCSINTKEMSKLSADEFAEHMANLYVDLDYCHLFNDGNSRAIGALISDIAREAGFNIDWGRSFNPDLRISEEFHIARDISVNKLAMRNMFLGPFEDVIKECNDKFERWGYKDLVSQFQDMTTEQEKFLSMKKFNNLFPPKGATRPSGKDNGIDID